MVLTPVLTKGKWWVGPSLAGGIGVATFMSTTAIQARWPISIDTTPLILGMTLIVVAGWVGNIENLSRETIRRGLFLAQRSALMRPMADGSFDGLVVIDVSERIVRANTAACRLWNRSEANLIGRPISDLLVIDLVGSTDKERSGVLKRPTGDCLPVHFTVGQITAWVGGESDDPIESVYTIRDATERKAAEAAREKARDEAVAASRAKSEFMANMSHELRTPLNAIIGFSEMISSELMGPIGQPKYKQYADDIHGAGTHLLALVNDILDIARVESGEYQLTESISQ